MIFFCTLFRMIIPKCSKRPAAPNGADRPSRWNLAGPARHLPLLLLLGALLSVAGCAAKQPAPVSQPQPQPQVSQEKHSDVITAARSNIGIPYKFGGSTPETGFDCSGLVCWSYEQVGITLPRRARDQHEFGIKIDKKEDLQPGDIVVFKGTNSRTGWHSGIYTGNGMFVHSPTKGKTVTETPLDQKYFAKRFAGARRIPRDGSAAELLTAFNKQNQAVQKSAAPKAKKRKSSPPDRFGKKK